MKENFDLKELKEIELNLLREFIRICNKHHLKWFALGGTCLGAVRHKGFIPWDDDIDVGMPRDQYEKFLMIAPEELSSSYFLQSNKTETEFFANFAKLRDSNTTFIEASMAKFTINHGVYLDIFPLDGYKNEKWFDVLNALYSRRIGYEFDTMMKDKGIGAKIKRKIIKCIFPSVRNTVKKREKILSHFDYYNSDKIANFCGAWGRKEIVSGSCFGNGQKAIFEGIEIIIPENYDLYLSSLYGDYMLMPPEEERVSHHFTTVIDFRNSYVKYI